MHVSLDGFVAGPNGEMDWIKVDEELFDYAGRETDNADTALYGRKTWQMMDAYWPEAGSQPDASRHDRKHSGWYNSVTKIVLSKTMQGRDLKHTRIIGEDIAGELGQLKQQEGKNILMFGSPAAAHALMKHDLIDNYWLFINPVTLGEGIPLFAGTRHKLKLVATKVFSSGVVGVQYERAVH